MLGIKVLDLVSMKNLVYIWSIFVRRFSWDFKSIYLVYCKAKTEMSTDQDWIGLQLFSKLADQDWIGLRTFL